VSELRWKTAEAGEPGLFDVDELFAPGRSTGRMSDLEFLHVTAKRILNHVPSASRAPANWTINVYRGCSHACSYCVAADTAVLMADGRTRPIADIRAGDVVYGTARRGTCRYYVLSTVLDHWRTVEAAYRITLADGTRVVASADHRFLTERGWKYVTGCARPHLTTHDTLVGVGHGHEVHGGVLRISNADPKNLRVTALEPLGSAVPMCDMTTTSGDFIANGVVSHNCFARPTHEYLGFNIGTDFDRKIVVKINAVEKLRAELADPRWRGEAVAMGTNTDPYQRAEAKYRLTRGVLEALAERSNPFSILTKSPLVTRDLDVLVEAARRAHVSVNFSIGTLDQRVWRASEPGSPNPLRRIDAMARLSAAGIRTGALMAPILPGLSDAPEQLRATIAAIQDAGGRLLGLGPLHLRPGVREHFLSWLAELDPGLHADYRRRYATTAYAPRRYLTELHARAGLPDTASAGRLD
jgi:DNA repair photolyase